jgi:hypothetical protein
MYDAFVDGIGIFPAASWLSSSGAVVEASSRGFMHCFPAIRAPEVRIT